MRQGTDPAKPAADTWQVAPLDLGVLALLVGLKLLVHLATAGRYGYFRDELYFLDCGRHLDWGYVDCAPLIAVYAKIALLLGGSLPAVRTLAALAGAARVALTTLLARELGGGRFSQALAGLCALAAPIYLGVDSILTMNGFESLFWMGCVFFLIRIARTGDSRLWLWFGVLAGLGLENKHSTLLFGGAVAAALLLSSQRRELLRPWVWMAGGIALLIFLPNLVWQVQHGYPTLEDLENVRRSGKNVVLSPTEFVGQQALLLHPALLPFWLAGLASFLFGKRSRLRILGWTYLVLLVTMIVLKAKNYYLTPIYPMLFASGAVAAEGWFARGTWSRGRLWPKAVLAAYVFAAGAVITPAVLPILAPAELLAYQRRIGLAPPKTEVRHQGPLDQRLGDQFGWEELVADVARIYKSLPEEERARTGIFASNYGEAGALNLFGPALGLPAPICAHQNHYFWGPPTPEPENLIWLQWGRQGVEDHCRSVEKAGEHFHPWGMAEENRPIYLCRGLRHTLAEYWTPDFKHWN
ncbi:MAG: glycosyltransferase family 39 protein [Thermoanaerobaculia bacterium]